MASGADPHSLVSGTREHVILDTYPETSVSCDVAATAEQRWPLVSDITVPARFSDEL